MQYASDATTATPRSSGKSRNRTPWIVAAVVVVAVIVSGAFVANNVISTTEDATTAAVSTDTGLLEEATTGRIAEPGNTTQYFGYSGELFPEGAVSDPHSRSLSERQLDRAYRSQNAEAVPGTASVGEQELMESLVNQGLIPAAALEGVAAGSVDSAVGEDALDRAIANGRLNPPPGDASPSRPGGSELGRIGEPMP